MITQEFDLNLIPDSQEPVIVHVSQYDIGAGRLIAHLYAGDIAYTIASGAHVTIQGTKSDRVGFKYENLSYSGNTVTANLTEQMCAAAGRTVTNITVEEAGNRTGSFNFILDVQPAALGDGTVISRSDGSIYEIPDLVASAEQSATNAAASATAAASSATSAANSATSANSSKNSASTSATNAANSATSAASSASSATSSKNAASASATAADTSAKDSEAYAKGTRGGTAVGSSDPAYHNNSKYYAEQAEDAKETIINDGYLVGVDPTTIEDPESPYLLPSDVIDNLTSNDAHKPLSARQGKVLNELIHSVTPGSEYLKTTDVVNNLTSTATDKPLSANQGKILNDNKVNVSDIIDNLTSTATNKPLSAKQGKELKTLIDNVTPGSEYLKTTDVIDNLTSTTTDKPLSAKQGKVLNDGKINTTDIVDNLTSTSSSKVLSAKQGKALNDTKINTTDIVDNLTTNDDTKPLSAKQGKVLNDGKVNITDIKNNLTSTDTNKPLSANQGKVLNESKINKSDIVDNLTSTDVDKPLSAKQGKVLKDGLDSIDLSGFVKSVEPSEIEDPQSPYLETSDVINNLTSTATDKPLSANQGRVLNDSKVNITDIVDALTSADSSKPLSAKQGKVLNDGKVNISDIVDDLLSEDSSKPLSANQGRVLKALIDSATPGSEYLKTTDVVNNLSSTTTNKPLSANQGKVLKGMIPTISKANSVTIYRDNMCSTVGKEIPAQSFGTFYLKKSDISNFYDVAFFEVFRYSNVESSNTTNYDLISAFYERYNYYDSQDDTYKPAFEVKVYNPSSNAITINNVRLYVFLVN